MNAETNFRNAGTVSSSRIFTRLGEFMLGWKKYPEDRPNADPESEIAPKIREILGRPEFAGLRPYLVGGPIFHYEFDQLASSETPTFMGLCLVIQMALLAWLGRGVRGVAVPIAIVVISIVWTFFWALLADLFFSPALLLLLKPLGPERLRAADHLLQPVPTEWEATIRSIS